MQANISNYIIQPQKPPLTNLSLPSRSVATYFGCGGLYYMAFVYDLLLFPTVKNFANPLRFDKVIATSWWSTFLEHSVCINKTG